MVSVLGLFYVYVGYPCLLLLLCRNKKKSVGCLKKYPRVSVLISARNEARVIKSKLQNTLGLEYPEDLLEVLVISDASTDGTDQIVREYGNNRISLVRLEVRRGKSAGLNEAVPIAKGEIIVMTDANAMLEKDALGELIKNFSDPCIGFVTGWTRYGVDGDEQIGGSARLYTRIEGRLKTMESLVSSCVGADGAIFAVRRELYEPLQDEEINDLGLPLRIVGQRYRGVFEAGALCTEEASRNANEEFQRQVRITNRTLHAILKHWKFLNPMSYGWFAVELLSHKLFRFFTPYLLLTLFICNLFLIKEGIVYQIFFGLQGFFYTFAIIGIFFRSDNKLFIFISLCTHFVMTNVAYIGGWIRFITRSPDTVWERIR